MKRLLIVIPCLNEARHIGGLLAQLLPFAQARGARIVVADGGSTDGTIGIVSEIARGAPEVELLRNPARLQSAGVNLAVDRYGAQADWLIRIDAHAGYPADYCETLLKEADATGADAVTVSLKAVGSGKVQTLAAAAQNSILGNGGSAHRNVTEGKWVDHGHHALINIAAFRAVGGYDESFRTNEDAELDLRLTRAGYRIWLTGLTQIDYYPRRTLRDLARQYFRYGHGRAQTLKKHSMRAKPRQRAMILVAPALAFTPMGIWFWPFFIPAALWLSACLAGGIALAIKTQDLSLALTGPLAALMHASWSIGFWSAQRPHAQIRKQQPA